MMKSKISRNLARLLAGFLLLASPAFAQTQGELANHAVAIGKGPGFQGLGGAVPGASGTVLTSAGSTTDPAFAALPTLVYATAAQYLAGTVSNVPIPPSIIYPTEVTVTFGATTTFDFQTFINASVTLTGNITTQTLSNITAGKAGTIAFIQDGTGSRTTVWNSAFKFASGAAPALSTAANAIDLLSYSCRSATNCPASLLKDVR